jgi:thioester reductase-like protein
MKKEIAIIGISMKVAGAENLEEFWASIEKGETGFKALSAIRQKDIFDRFGEFEIATGSYLDRVDLFDNEFFKIAPAEAERMDPEQRLMMECAVKAVNNAGYLIKELKGQPIGIFHTFESSRYRNFFDDTSNLSITAHMPGMVGTRVANFMDWRGPVIGIDTTCSSSLTALYYACQSLTNGDCNMAMVGGASLGVSSKQAFMNSPVMSKNEQCLPFDDDADGTLAGEGIICVLLKKADDAIRDGDPIHAIIKGGAINHGGALIQNISAPSPISQSEVIRKAWENSKVDPKNIRFIEAHGTGTILGDPIEFSGINAAFEGIVESGEKVCSISSIKGQLGHLNTVAGLAGLIRLVLALKNKQVLPQHGFKKINSHINEKDSPVSIQRQMEYWKSDHHRIGGVSSFGLTGTNVHMIIEEYAAPIATAPDNDKLQTYLLKVGGATESKAVIITEYLKKYLKKKPAVNLSQLCYSVNKMLEDVQYGQLISFKNHQELEHILNGPSFIKPRKKVKGQQVFLLIPNILSLGNITSFAAQSNSLATAYQFELESAGHHNEQLNENQQSFLLHYCAAKLLIQAGFSPDKIIGAQSGKLISLLLTGKITMSEAMTQLHSGNNTEEPFNSDGFIQFLHSLDPGTDYLFVMMGSNGEMYDACKQWLKEHAPQNIQAIFPKDEAAIFLEIIAAYYNQGNDLGFDNLFTKELFLHDLRLPLLEPKRFWPNVKPFASGIIEKKESINDHKSPKKNLNLEEIIEGVRVIWCEKLKVDTVNRQDDFFDLGGSSLLGLDILQLIGKRFEVSLEYADIFDYCTIQAQAELIEEKLISVQAGSSATKETEDKTVTLPIDYDQRQMRYDQLILAIKNQPSIAAISPKHILLTGGTGFLGVYIIKELLAKTQAKISCLVRAATDDIATERLIDTLKSYFPDYKLDYNRLNGIKGDITQPDLDLSISGNNRLTNIDTVYHLAANVSHFGKAEITSKINFEGTVNMLEWSKKAAVSCFNHFSTNAVGNAGYIDNVESIHFYESDLDLGQNFGRRIYPESKFKAEQYINENKGKLNVNVFRIGNIGGDSVTGLFQKNIESNNFYQRIKTLAGLRYYCDEITGHAFETTPVDLVSAIVVRLSLHKNEVLNTFHILESDPIRLSQMVQELATCHIELQKIDIDSFLKHVEKLSSDSNFSTENSILGIIKYGTNDTAYTRVTICQDATKAYLEKIGVPYTYNKEQYANTIIKYCIQKKFINQSVDEKITDVSLS